MPLWLLCAFDSRERPKIGDPQLVWTTVARTEEVVLREMWPGEVARYPSS